MQQAQFPSQAFPAYPRLSVNKPDGWVELAAVGLPLALAAEVPAGAFRPNVLVTLTRHGADFQVEHAVKDLNKRLKALTRFREEERVTGHAHGGDRIRVRGRFAGARGEVVRQDVSVVVINRGHVYDVVEITGTCSLASGDNRETEIRSVIDSLVVTCDE